jgi:hypothetical protein
MARDIDADKLAALEALLQKDLARRLQDKIAKDGFAAIDTGVPRIRTTDPATLRLRPLRLRSQRLICTHSTRRPGKALSPSK